MAELRPELKHVKALASSALLAVPNRKGLPEVESEAAAAAFRVAWSSGFIDKFRASTAESAISGVTLKLKQIKTILKT